MRMRVEPGRLRTPVTLQQRIVAEDAAGNQTQSWETVMQAMAAVNSLYGQEYWAAAAQGQQDTVTAVLRWCPALGQAAADADLTGWRIVIEEVPYRILRFDDVEFRHTLVKIRAVRK